MEIVEESDEDEEGEEDAPLRVSLPNVTSQLVNRPTTGGKIVEIVEESDEDDGEEVVVRQVGTASVADVAGDNVRCRQVSVDMCMGLFLYVYMSLFMNIWVSLDMR